MDRNKKPLEQVGEWTTVHKKPNKGKQINPNQGFTPNQGLTPNQGFTPILTGFYPNEGYYVPYPMVRQPTGSPSSYASRMVNEYPSKRIIQSPWSQDPNSAYQASYSEVIKGAENLLKQQQIPEIKDIYNPGLPSEIYKYINEIWKTHILEQRANFRRALTKFSQFLVEKTTKENEAHDLLLKAVLYRDWEELEIEYTNINEINNLIDIFQYFIHKGTNSPIMNKMFRICLYNKARKILPEKINKIICNQQTHYKKVFSKYFL